MQISIIIPAINEAASIEHAVTSAWATGASEVIVADGGSNDATRDLAAAAGAKVIESPPGRAIQQNAGAAMATGDVLLFQHADNWCGPDSIPQIEAALANAKVLGGAFRQNIDAPGMKYRLLERGNAWRVRVTGIAYGDQGIFMRRAMFEKLGGFPQVPLMEDLLLMRGFRKLTWPVLLAGPHHVSPRRWERDGVVRRTLRNWHLVARFALGASPEELAKQYRAQDEHSRVAS
jgi:rSAM/selenodomain-associated transferase 2